MGASAFFKEVSAQESLLHGPISTAGKSFENRFLLGNKGEHDLGILIQLSRGGSTAGC